MNIGRKFILSFLLVTLVPTVLLAFLTTTIISSSRKDDAQETINHNLKAAWMQYYARAYQMQYGMVQASTESYIRKSIEQRDKELLKAQIIEWKKYRTYVDIWDIVDRDARVIASLNNARPGMRLSFDGLVEDALMKKTSFIATEKVPYGLLKEEGMAERARILFGPEKEGSLKEVRDGMMIIVVTPVFNKGGSVIGGIVTGNLINNDPSIPDALAESIPGSLVTITMGDIQVSTNVTDETGKRTIGHSIPNEVINGLNRNLGFRGETSIAGQYYITAFDPIIDHLGKIVGSISVGLPKDKFADLQNKNIKAVITIALIGLFLATAVASLITYMITKPIKTLTKKAQLVSSGDLNIRVGVSKDGTDEIADLARAFEIMIENLRDNEGRIKLSQDKLNQQKYLIESIINSLPYCLYVLERNLSIVVWNRHASSGCPICNSSEDCYNFNFIAHLPNQKLKNGLDDRINRVFDTGGPCQFEKRLVLHGEDGKETVIRTNIFPIISEKGGPVDYVVWMTEDITKKKEIEATVIASEKLAAIGQLAAGVAHEVNNPLGGILNCLYNFKNKKLTEERKAEYLDFMEEGIKRAQNIVKQLLDFSQQHIPEFSLTDINRMIEGIAPLFLHSIKGKDIRLVRNLGQGLPEILVDKHQIEQVLVNLILNAIQALKGEGLIEVSTKFEGNWYCISVSDNGCGIPPENISRVFDPFFTTKDVGKGTGLGLSVSRGIIEQHKGKIDVESQVGKGTVFKVFLPIASV